MPGGTDILVPQVGPHMALSEKPTIRETYLQSSAEQGPAGNRFLWLFLDAASPSQPSRALWEMRTFLHSCIQTPCSSKLDPRTRIVPVLWVNCDKAVQWILSDGVCPLSLVLRIQREEFVVVFQENNISVPGLTTRRPGIQCVAEKGRRSDGSEQIHCQFECTPFATAASVLIPFRLELEGFLASPFPLTYTVNCGSKLPDAQAGLCALSIKIKVHRTGLFCREISLQAHLAQ